jgi:hypothetical protein
LRMSASLHYSADESVYQPEEVGTGGGYYQSCNHEIECGFGIAHFEFRFHVFSPFGADCTVTLTLGRVSAALHSFNFEPHSRAWSVRQLEGIYLLFALVVATGAN